MYGEFAFQQTENVNEVSTLLGRGGTQRFGQRIATEKRLCRVRRSTVESFVKREFFRVFVLQEGEEAAKHGLLFRRQESHVPTVERAETIEVQIRRDMAAYPPLRNEEASWVMRELKRW